MTTDSIIDRIEQSRTELLDLSLRNPLLNYKLLKSKGVEASGEKAAEVFRQLVLDRKPLRLLTTDARRVSDGIKTTEEDAELLDECLLRTLTDANTLLEEQGVNTLFVALGMVRWYESDSSEMERSAPLVLIPVRIERADVSSPFRVSYSGEDLGANIAFIQKVQNDFDIELPDILGGEEADAEDVDVSAYCADVASAISRVNRWSVEQDSVVLGFFSFNKLLMFRDLAPESWHEYGNPHDSGMIRALLREGFRESVSEIADADHLDDYLGAGDTYHVVDADSTQAKAIHDVNNGRSIIIQGPPGTGKSQTITNIIAESVARGKTVLFVAEKMAALEVVARRLTSVALGDVVLELHSHKTQRGAVINELQRTLELTEPRMDGIEDDFIALSRTRDELNEYAAAVNTPVGDTGVTPYRAYGELLRLARHDGEPLPRLRVDGIESYSDSDYRRKVEVIMELQTLLGRMGVPRDHIFRGTRLSALTPLTQADMRYTIADAMQMLDALLEEAGNLAAALEVGAPADAEQVRAMLPDTQGVDLDALHPENRQQEMRALLDCLERYENLHARYGDIVRPNAWNADVSDIHRRLSESSIIMRGASAISFGQKRQFRSRWVTRNLGDDGGLTAPLCRGVPPQGIEEQLALVEAIIAEQSVLREIAQLTPSAVAVLGDVWQGLDTNKDEIESVLKWALAIVGEVDTAQPDTFPAYLNVLYSQTSAMLDSYWKAMAALEEVFELDAVRQFGNADSLAALPFEKLGDVLAQWRDGASKVREMVRFNLATARAAEENLEAVIDLAREWEGAPERLAECFEGARYNAILSRAFEERSSLAGFDTDVHLRRIEQFRMMDELSLRHNRIRVAHAHWSRLPDPESAGHLGVLRREFAKRRRHLPVRQLMEQAGSAVQSIKPVFMMSPLSVATYLKPGSVKFDLVVFDEASQVKPVDALGALFRGNQAVVVGDEKQLPPTDFFEGVSQDEDDLAGAASVSATADMESILSLFYAQGAPSRMLRWHYRSRHESLIAVSNNSFYNNRLVVFPSPDARTQGVGLQYHWLDTHYARGGVNREEARYVAQAVMEHAREQPELSLGVATFSAAQRDAVQREVERLRRDNSEQEAFFNAHSDAPFFVKNLENVQGDERDVIFISVAYGRDAEGVVRQNFGPLNREGGERRLNVLISRACLRCEVFTNLRSGDIRLDQDGRGGLAAFRDFLAYAEIGEVESWPQANSERTSPFQKEIAEKLRAAGHDCHETMDASGFFVDMAIADPDHPGRYVLGIECDGESYHGSQAARDRDRLKEQVLRSLGWRLHRVWSTDWFADPEYELERAIQAIEDALSV